MNSFVPKSLLSRKVAAAAVLLACVAAGGAYQPTSRYVVKEIEGWQVYVHRDLLVGGKSRDVGEPALAKLRYGLAKVRQMVDDKPLAKLQEVKIWLEVDSTNGRHGRTSAYQYHPNLDWLERMDFNPAKVKCVEFGTAAGLAKRSDLRTVEVTMHELAHAFHDQVLGFEDEDVLAAHKRGREEGKYPPGDWVIKANHKEFFAGLSTRWFESEQTRKQIVERDPVFARKLEHYWHKPKALFAAPLKQPVSAEPDAKRANTVMWYDKPAEAWTEALPLGNGRLGALVYGKVSGEVIHLNEDTFWAGGPYTHVNPEGAKHIGEVRRLIFEKKYRQAHELFDRTMLGAPAEQLKYLPLCDLELSFPFAARIEDYRRELDLATGVATVRYRAGGVTYTREALVSAADQVIVVRVTADKPGAVDMGVWLAGRTNDQAGTGETFAVQAERDGLTLSGRNCDDRGVPGRVKYEARLRVIQDGGRTWVNGSGDRRRLRVRGANSATILVSAATSFVNYKDVSGDASAKAGRHLAAAAAKTYEQLRADSIAEHARLFGRVEFALTPTPDAARPTDVRLKNFDVSDDPQLAALIYQYGRYLLLCSSRPGTQPANLQGIWNPRPTPSWESKYTTNINVEMNYWPAEVGNLAECVGPLEDLIRDISTGPGVLVARKQYDANGWVLHQNTDVWRASAPMDGASWGTWTLGGAWICTHLWEHYLFDPNERYLRRVYPILKGSCEFFLDRLVEHPEKKWLVTCPSTSPENSPRDREDKSPAPEDGRRRRGSTICAGPTMDMQILRYLFAATAKAADVLGVDADFRKRLLRARGRLAPNQIGKHGQLQEWLGDWDSPKDHHRHLSHLWGMYPGDEINLRRTPDLARAVAKSLEMRGEGGTGFGMTWQVALWARLRNNEKALRMLTHNVMQNTLPNLFSKCFGAPQVDGTFGAAAGVAEMLIQSHTDSIILLPALPSQWPDGHVKGLRARGGFELDFAWKDGRLTALTVHSKAGRPLKIRYGDHGDTAVIHLKQTEAGKSYCFDDRFGFSLHDDPKRGRLLIKEADKKILHYNYGMQLNAGVDEKYERACYIHPLWDVTSWQRTLTEDFPMLDEHYHHRGLSWMWPGVKVREQNVSTWEPSEPPLRQHFVKWLRREATHDRAVVAVENAWLLDDREKVMTETVEIVARPLRTVTTVCDKELTHNRPMEIDAREIDLTLTFEAVGGPIELRGGYYGGLMLRGSSDMQYLGEIVTDRGKLDGDQGGQYAWADLTSRPEPFYKIRGVAVFLHPSHPRCTPNPRRPDRKLFPPYWLCRTSWCGLMNPFWPGNRPLELRPGKPVTLRYRLYVHEGDAELAQVAQAYEKYVRQAGQTATVQ